MAATTTKIGICNRALQLAGYPAISSLQENSRGAKAMNRAYDPVLASELRKHFWNFAIRRASLPASATPPAFGKANYYPLPGDYLMLAPNDQALSTQTGGGTLGFPDQHDWQIEGNQIASNETAPIQIRYISNNILESVFDVSFAECLAVSLALNTIEELTNSNAKAQNLNTAYDAAIKMARKRNAFENRPVMSPLDTWVTVRL